jgi:hypothetical protein
VNVPKPPQNPNEFLMSKLEWCCRKEQHPIKRAGERPFARSQILI